MKSTQFYNFPLWEISDVQPLLDTVNDSTNKIDQAMEAEQTNISKNTESIAQLTTKVDTNTKSIAQLKSNSSIIDKNLSELSTKVETNTDEILQLSNDLTNQVTAFKRLSNAITSFCHKRL